MSSLVTSVSAKTVPIIVVLGATGTGKSKLAIQLAKKFSGEVISADSMQVYRGLDIVTNKVTAEEAQGVPHHCFDFVDPLAKFTVIDFARHALPIVERLMKEDKMPVIVGGTHYYIEALLWKVLVAGSYDSEPRDEPGQELKDCKPEGPRAQLTLLLEELHFMLDSAPTTLGESDISKLNTFLKTGDEGLLKRLEAVLFDLPKMTDEEIQKMVSLIGDAEEILQRHHPDKRRLENRTLHSRLREVDPDRAAELHYNDIRKVKRSLEVLAQTKKTHSEIIREQRGAPGGSEFGGPLRFPAQNTAVFWIGADMETLDRRLDERVDDMVSRGLVGELESFHLEYNRQRIAGQGADQGEAYTQGIFQSIGFKEFHKYLILEDKTSEQAKEYLQEGITALKIATRRYARSQIKWIKKRFLKPRGRPVPPLYELDATDLSKWNEKVSIPAEAVVSHLLGLEPENGASIPSPAIPETYEGKSPKTEHFCKVCFRRFIGDHQWESHLHSKKHKSLVKKKGLKSEKIQSS